ncbi:MAG: hypothetical protein ABW139_19860 [Candidatus Thiodiazotropha sp. DIVDIV]
MNTQTSISLYAIRRLNPFLGVLQIIETEGGRASTTNGLVWHIELHKSRPADWGSLNVSDEQKSWYLFGLWSEKEGLIKAPTSSSSGGLIVQQLVKAIQDHQHELPFPLNDHRELWLLDGVEQKPLALLMSMVPGSDFSNQKPRYWRGCLEKQGIGGQHQFAEIDPLEREVRKRAGFNISRLWVTWDSLRTEAETDQGVRFSRDVFPSFGISEHWQEERNYKLVQRYIDWISPALLTLPNLNETERARLESSLDRRACRIEYYWRLYPKILDTKKIVSARVQARLQTGKGF